MSLDKLYPLLAEYEKAVEDLERLRAHNELWPKSAVALVWHTREDRVITARLALRKLLEAAA